MKSPLPSAPGSPPTTPLGAASWAARSFLGLPGLEEGGFADLVGFVRNPSRSAAEPSLIILDGRVIRAPVAA